MPTETSKTEGTQQSQGVVSPPPPDGERKSPPPPSVERPTFLRAQRFHDVPDDDAARPHAYRGFTSLLERVHGRAVSPIGTFSTGARSTLGNRAATPVSFYESRDQFVDIRHSRGVKRTAPRFQNAVDDASPGPIYKPFHDLSSSSTVSVKFSRAPRFPPPTISLQAGGRHYSAAEKQSSNTPTRHNNQKAEAQGSKPRCTFGVRHDHLVVKPATVVPAVPLVGPVDPVAQLPRYSGKFLSAARVSGIDEITTHATTPGPGHFLKADYQPTSAAYTMGRPRHTHGSRQHAATPGPGAYRIEKFSPISRPPLSTFARCGHESVAVGAPGWDSPGPALYAPKQHY